MALYPLHKNNITIASKLYYLSARARARQRGCGVLYLTSFSAYRSVFYLRQAYIFLRTYELANGWQNFTHNEAFIARIALVC